MYTDALNTSLTAQGTLSQQNAIYLQSFTAKLHQFQAALDDVKDSALDEETLKDFVDFGTDAVTLLARFIDGIGGMRGVLVGIGALLPRIFDKQLNSTFTTLLTNIQRVKHNTEEANAVLQITSKFTQYAGQLKDPQMKIQLDTLVKMRETANQYRNVMSQADNEHYNALIKQKAELMNQSNTYKDFIDKTVKYAQDISGKKILSGRATDAQTGQILNTHGSDGAYTFAEKGRENLDKVIKQLDEQEGKYTDKIVQIEQALGRSTIRARDADKAIKEQIKEKNQQVEKTRQEAEKLKQEATQSVEQASNYLKQIQDGQKLLGQKRAELNKIVGKYSSKQVGNQEKKQLKERIKQLEEEIKELNTQIKADKDTYNYTEKVKNNQEKKASQKFEQVANLAEKARKAEQHLGEGTAKLSEEFSRIGKEATSFAEALSGTPLDKYASKINDLTTILESNTASQKEKRSALTELKGVYGQIRDQIKNVNADLNEQTKKQQAAAEAAKAHKLAQEELNAKLQVQELANRFTSGVQAISSFGFALNSLNGVIDTFANKDLSPYDKMLRILTTAPMLITSVISTLKALNTTLGANVSITTFSNAANAIANKLGLEKKTILPIAIALMKSQTVAQAEQNVAQVTGNSVEEISNLLKEKEIGINTVLAASRKALIGIGIAAATMVVIGAIRALIKAKEEERKIYIENQQAIYDDIQAKKEQIKANQELIKSYQSVYEQYKAGTASKEQMTDAANSLSNVLNNEAIAVANLTGNYDDLTKAVDEFNKKSKEEQRERLNSQLNAASNIATANITGQTNIFSERNPLLRYGSNAEGILKAYDQVTQAISQADGQLDAYQRKLIKYQQKYKDQVEQYRKVFYESENLAIQDIIGEQSYDTIESFETNIKALEGQLKNFYQYKDYSDEQIKNEAIKLAQTYSKEASLAFKRYATANEILGDNISEGTVKKVHEVVNKLNEEQLGVVLQVGLDEQHIDNWIKATQAAVDISEATEGLANLRPAIENLHKGTELEAEAIQKLEKQYTELADIWDKSSNDYLDKLREIAQLEEQRIQTATRSQLASARDTVERNIAALGTSTYQANYKKNREDASARLNDLKLYYQDQINAIQYQQQKNKQLGFVEASKESIEALENANKKLAQTEKYLKKVNEEAEKTVQIPKEIADAEAAQELEKLADSLQVYGQQVIKLEQLKTEDLVTDADNVIDQAENIAKAVELIKDGFKVDADGYEELFRMFPQLAEDAQVLADGVIQLDESVVRTVLDGNSNIMASEAGLTEASIRNRIEDLEAHKKSLESKLENVQKATSAELSSETQLRRLLGENYDSYTQYVTELSADQALDEVANAKASTEKILDFWYQKEQAARQYAAVAAAAQSPEHTTLQTQRRSVKELSISTKPKATDARQAKQRRQARNQDAKARRAAAQEQIRANIEQFLKNSIASDERQIADLTIALGKLKHGIDDIGTAAKGAGSDAKTATKDLLDELKDELDIYHDINIQLGDIETALNRIADNEDKLIRSGLTENLKKQNELLDKQVETLKRKAELQQQDALNRSAELSALGATFDAYGNISNYMDLLTAKQSEYNGLVAEYNALMTEYNALGSKDAQQAMQPAIDALKDKIDQTKDDYDDLKDKIADYDSLKDAIDQLQDDIIDSINKKIENNIKAFKIEIDVQLDKNEYQRDWNQFQKTANRIAEDNYKELSENRLASFHSYYNTEGTGDVQELINQLNKTRAEVEKMEANQWSDIYGHNEAQALEDLKTYNDRLMQSLEDVEQIVKDIHDNYLSEIDKAKDAFDDQVSQYEHINKLIGHGKNLTSLLYGDDDYDKLSKYYDMQAQNSNAQIDFYRRQTQLWKQNMDAAQEGSEEWVKFRNNWQNSVSDMNTAVESAVSNLIDKYTAATNDIIKKTRDQMAGGSWSKMQSEWDKYKWDDDRYLDQLTRATEIANFTDEVNKAMQGLNPKQQQTMLKFMNDQVDKLSQEGNLRAFNVEVANRELEILKQQMALEDARNAKTTMRLRRDSQGNYTYQYVADTTAADDAAATLRNSIEELRQFVESDMESSMDELMQKSDEFAQKWAEVCEQNRGNDEALKQAQLALQEEYFGQNGYITNLNKDYNIAQQDLFDAIGAEYGTLMNDLGADTRNFLGIGEDAAGDSVWGAIVDLLGTDGTDGRIPTVVDAFVNDKFGDATTRMAQMNQNLLFGQAQGQEGLVPGWNDATLLLGEDIDKLTETVKSSMDKCVQENEEYIESLDKVEESAGVDFENIDEYIESTSQQTQELIQDNQELIDKYGDEIAAVASVCAEMAELTAAYEANRDAALECAEANYKMWQSAEGFNPDTVSVSSQTAISAASKKASDAATGTGDSGSGSGNSESRGVTATTAKTARLEPGTDANNNIRYNIVGGGLSQGWLDIASTQKVIDELKQKGYTIETRNEAIKAEAKKKGLVFKVGGYTGTWSNGSYDGMPALLHQKEYVLNAQDTPNVLRAVQIANKIMDSLSGLGTAAIDSMLSGRTIPTFNAAAAQSTNQNVNIYADFPNVSDALEIKNALNTLVNRASQMVSQNRRTY